MDYPSEIPRDIIKRADNPLSVEKHIDPWSCNNSSMIRVRVADFDNGFPVDTRHNNNVIITSKRRRDVVLTS